MLILNGKNPTPNKKQPIRPGTYPSVVKAVGWSPGHVEGTAFTIHYLLTLPNGTEAEFKELFFNNTRNTRTDALDTYLKKNGIVDLSDFVGCAEELIIAKRNDGYKSYLTIADRTFISAAGSTGVTNDLGSAG